MSVPEPSQCQIQHPRQGDRVAKTQNGAHTPCGVSASFSPFPPGDGGREGLRSGLLWLLPEDRGCSDLQRECRIPRSHLSITCMKFVKTARAVIRWQCLK